MPSTTLFVSFIRFIRATVQYSSHLGSMIVKRFVWRQYYCSRSPRCPLPSTLSSSPRSPLLASLHPLLSPKFLHVLTEISYRLPFFSIRRRRTSERESRAFCLLFRSIQLASSGRSRECHGAPGASLENIIFPERRRREMMARARPDLAVSCRIVALRCWKDDPSGMANDRKPGL